MQAISLLVWGLIGVALLAWLQVESEIVTGALFGLALLAVGIAGFVMVQRAGALGGLARTAGRFSRSLALSGLASSAGEADAAIRALYDRPGVIAAACSWRLVSRVLLTAEILLAASLMGHPIGLAEAFMMRSLIAALRGAAFMVPNGLGVQEGGFVLLGSLLGYSPEFMLALSLATRARELLISVPGVLYWQHAEGRGFWRRRKPS